MTAIATAAAIAESPRLAGFSWRRPWRVQSHRAGAGAGDGSHRLEVRVAGAALWFASDDLPLAHVPEAWGSALLLPAAFRHRHLAFDVPLDPVWKQNAGGALALAAAWWDSPAPRMRPAAPPTVPGLPGAAAALCFSGGVDSFYSLRTGLDRISTLLFIHGYDMPLGDRTRAAAAEASVRAVAAACGLRAVVLRTNLRLHPALRGARWERIHGGALAAAGHFLGHHLGELLISASYPRAFDRPWGSHWQLDPHWSSSRLAVSHVGAETWRTDKLLALLDDPLAQHHLRVCWENRSETGNCGRCEKCLRTMLILEGAGSLDRFTVFPKSRALAENLLNLPPLRADLLPVYARFLRANLGADVRRAVEALLQRSASSDTGRRAWWTRTRHHD